MEPSKSKLSIVVLIAAVAVLFGVVAFFRFGNVGTTALWNLSNSGQWLLPLVSVAALIDSLNPCAFSILLLTVAFLVGFGAVRGKIVAVGTSYILGLFVVYLLIGFGILQALHLFSTPHFMARVGASVLVAWGMLTLVNHFFPAFLPVKLRIPQASHQVMARLMEKASLPGAFALGGLVGLCEFPCTGGPYLLVLGLLHDQGTYLKGVGYLVLYNLIFILPLVVILALSSNRLLLDRVRQWKREASGSLRLWGGLAMVALGLAIFAL
ncbi:hypothetical protein HYW67_02615 [Candidatus Parcubacteria bacterium]|nr:hypothetical protein [Candidatus Parcubacteria bacterium]